LGELGPSVCSVENVFCWARKYPAPREDGDKTTVYDGDQPVLEGENPIEVHVFESDHVLVNETLGPPNHQERHVLHDDFQPYLCADDPNIDANYDPQQDRCSFVHRKVFSDSAGDVLITTTGRGKNINGKWKVFNERTGQFIFNGIDQWIIHQVQTVGVCQDDPQE